MDGGGDNVEGRDPNPQEGRVIPGYRPMGGGVEGSDSDSQSSLHRLH